MSAITLYSDPHFSPANESALNQQRQQGFYLLDTYRHKPPGFWTDNKYQQVQHDAGVTYIAIRSIMDVIRCATVTVGRKKRKAGRSTMLGRGRLIKSHQHSQGSDSGDYDPVTDHPVCRLIERPNPVDTFGELLSYLTLQNRLTGVGPLWTVPSTTGKIAELYALPTALMVPQWQKTAEFPYGAWRVQPYYASGGLGYLPSPFSGTGAVIPNGEIQRMLDPHPMFQFDGKSPLSAGSFQLDILEEIDQARWAAFDHGVTMDAVLQVDGFDDNQIARLESRMEQKHQGTRNHRRFLVVSGQAGTEKMRLQSFSNSPKEMDFAQSWDQMVGFVLAIFGVPKSVSGLSQVTSYSELYAALRQFYQRQKSLAFRIAEFLTKALCWQHNQYPGEYRVQVDLPALDDPDLLEKQLTLDCSQGTITVNEARTLRNRPPVEDGDVPCAAYLQSFRPEPAAMPGMPGDAAAMGGDSPQDDLQGDETATDPQSIRDEITEQALQSMGVPGVEANGQLAAMLKAAPDPHKSGVFTDRRGRRFRVQDGKRVPLSETKPIGDDKTRMAKLFGDAESRRQGKNAARRDKKTAPGAPANTGNVPTAAEGKQWVQNTLGSRNAAAEVDRQLGRDDAPATERHAATPQGRSEMERAHEWADSQAAKHAQRVAAHFGVSPERAQQMLVESIRKLVANALQGGVSSGTVRGPGGKEMKIGVNRKGPTSGATPRPDNPQAAGSRPPLSKAAMSAYSAGLGAELIPPSMVGPGRSITLKRARTVRRTIKRILKGLRTADIDEG